MPGLIYPGAGQFSEEIKQRVDPGLLRDLLENLFSIESAASIGGNVDVGIPTNVGLSLADKIVEWSKTKLVGSNLAKVPTTIKNRYVAKVLRAVITNEWDDLTPFLSASVKKYGLKATQDLANTPAPLFEAYKLAGVDPSGFRYLRTLHGPLYDRAVKHVLMPK